MPKFFFTKFIVFSLFILLPGVLPEALKNNRTGFAAGVAVVFRLPTATAEKYCLVEVTN